MTLLEVGKWKYVGVDGCPGGWFAVGFDEDGEYGFELFCEFKELLKQVSEAKLVLIDIPIGLPEEFFGRECDFIARRLLGSKRGPSVFRAPTRQTVQQAAKCQDDYEKAKDIECECARHSLSKQTFNISAKIAEVDEALRCKGKECTPRPYAREVHPELCFWALNDGWPLEFPKKKERGVDERRGRKNA